MTNEINILACSNGGYFQHLAVVPVSLLANNPAVRFNIVLVTGESPGDPLLPVACKRWLRPLLQ